MDMFKGFCNSALIKKNLSGDFVLYFDELILSSLFSHFCSKQACKRVDNSADKVKGLPRANPV